MGDSWLWWLIGLPPGGAVLASILIYLSGRRSMGAGTTRTRLDALALLCAAGGLLLAMLVMVVAAGGAFVGGTGFAFSSPSRIILVVVNIALLCSLFAGWGSQARPERPVGIWSAALTSSLISAAVLSQDGVVSVLALLGAGVASAGSSCLIPLFAIPGTSDGDEARAALAKRVTGGLKHLSISVAGTGLLVVGILLLARYGLTLENKALPQLGLGLLSIGLLVRAGAMPFASASSDLIDAAPGAAINVLGAAAPAALLVGLHLLLPATSPGAPGCCGSSAWVGAVAVLLAGVRALGVGQHDHRTGSRGVPSDLVGATIALQTGWALTGLLSGSEGGQAGAILLAANLALAVPLVIVAGRWSVVGGRWAGVGVGVGVVSLLGLPPFGGFAGMLLVAQAAANLGGFWLALMLLGSMLVAARWVTLARSIPQYDANSSGAGHYERANVLDITLIMVLTLAAAQFALLLIFASQGLQVP